MAAPKADPDASVVNAEPPASDFVLGEGDLVQFTMFGRPDMETSAYVSAEGRISLPLIGAVDVGGLSPTAAAERASAAHEAGSYYVNPQINMTVEQYRSRQISVLDEVNKPGRYPGNSDRCVGRPAMAGMPTGGVTQATVIRRNGSGTKRLGVDLAKTLGPRPMFGVIFELGAEQRDSNQPDEEYDAFYGGVALRLELDSDRAPGERLPRVRD